MTNLMRAMFLALAGLLVATFPVAAMAMAGDMLCEQRLAAVSHHAAAEAVVAHAHDHGNGAHAAQTAAAGTPDAPAPAPVCCDHACVFEAPVVPVNFSVQRAASGVLHDWSSDDLAELTHPNGLRRPPKA